MIELNFIGPNLINTDSGNISTLKIQKSYNIKTRYNIEDSINAVIDTDQVIWFLLDHMTDMTRSLGNTYDMWTTT